MSNLPTDSVYLKASLLSALPKALSDLGCDPVEVFSKAHFNGAQLHDPNAYITKQQFETLIKVCREITGCNHVGLLLGVGVNIQIVGPIVHLMQSADTFQNAINVMIQNMHFGVKGLTRRLVSEGKISYITNETNGVELACYAEGMQMAVSILWKICRLVAGEHWAPKSVHFMFPEPKDKAQYARLFKVPVMFGADFNGLTFDTSDLARAPQKKDPALYQILQDYVRLINQHESSDFIDSVKSCIRKQLDCGDCSIDAVVGYFPFERRAFQRALEAEGLTYQKILSDVRFEKARTLLKNTETSLSQIADMLCYESTTTFSKAFKKQHGQTPSDWRKSHR